MTGRPLSPDAQSIALLCSLLGHEMSSDSPKPLTTQEWNKLANHLRRSNLRPGSLLGMDQSSMQSLLGLSAGDAKRLSSLLAQGARLAFEVERLSSLGIQVLARSEETYPHLLKRKLAELAPPVLFCSGSLGMLNQGIAAIVGSRDASDDDREFARTVGASLAREDACVVSGCARGIDQSAISGALDHGGRAIGVLPDGLEKAIRLSDYRQAISEGRLALVSSVHPKARFNVPNAMARNKIIYCLARFGLVVCSSAGSGGTRAGALEVLKHRWVPLYVRDGVKVSEGNRDLLLRGALSISEIPAVDFVGWLERHSQAWLQPKDKLRHSGLTKPMASAPASQSDLFEVVWPFIARELTECHEVGGLADRLSVEVGQMCAWLRRAEEADLVLHDQKSGEYVLRTEARGTGQMAFEM